MWARGEIEKSRWSNRQKINKDERDYTQTRRNADNKRSLLNHLEIEQQIVFLLNIQTLLFMCHSVKTLSVSTFMRLESFLNSC